MVVLFNAGCCASTQLCSLIITGSSASPSQSDFPLNLSHEEVCLELLPGALPAKAIQKDAVKADQSTTILDDAVIVIQWLTDLGSAACNIPELPAAGQIGIQIIEIFKVRPNLPIV